MSEGLKAALGFLVAVALIYLVWSFVIPFMGGP